MGTAEDVVVSPTALSSHAEEKANQSGDHEPLSTSHEKSSGIGPLVAEREPGSPLPTPPIEDNVVPTTKLQFFVILVALILAIFCVALDNTIIVTAIPRITDNFNTLRDVGW